MWHFVTSISSFISQSLTSVEMFLLVYGHKSQELFLILAHQGSLTGLKA